MSIQYPTEDVITKEESCYFCRETDNFSKKPSRLDGYEYYCPHCGSYQILRKAISILGSGYNFRALGTSIAQEKKISGLDNYVLAWQNVTGNDIAHQICVNNVPFLSSYPKDYLDKINRILVNIGRLTGNSPLVDYQPDYHDFGLFYVVPQEEYYSAEKPSDRAIENIKKQINDTLLILEGMKWIRFEPTLKYHWPTKIFLTIEGLKHLHELLSVAQNKRQAFVAMWFTDNQEYGDKLKKYRLSIDKAVQLSGYSKSFIADQEKYNGLIMNKVINQIRESRFLIADLTCDLMDGMRGGVYYEAGLADGLGMPVILTCHRDLFKDKNKEKLIHFDLKQFNTIFWYVDDSGIIRAEGHSEEDFSQYIADWIIKTVGKA